MKFTRESPGTLTIRSVSRDGILIDGQIWTDSVALTPEVLIEQWDAAAIDELVISDFESLLADSPELVILGTGAVGTFPPRELNFAFARRGIGLEVMDTAAAARTFNVLAGEGRRIGAVLYPL